MEKEELYPTEEEITNAYLETSEPWSANEFIEYGDFRIKYIVDNAIKKIREYIEANTKKSFGVDAIEGENLEALKELIR